MKKLIFLLLICGFLFADMAPGPEPPAITVLITEEGPAYLEDFTLVYRCSEPLTEESSNGFDLRDISFSCLEGVCTAEGWYYKFSPCFSGAQGYFLYEWDGEQKTTEQISFSQGIGYVVNLELTTASLVEHETQIVTEKPCYSVFLPFALLLFIRVTS